MDRVAIQLARTEMLESRRDCSPDMSFLALSDLAEESLRTSLVGAREVVAAAAKASGGFAKLESSAGQPLPLLEDADFLRCGLKAALDMVFRKENPIDIGISGNRANKISGRMYSAAELYCIAESALCKVEDQLRKVLPDAPGLDYRTAARALIALTDWDAAKTSDAALPGALLRGLQKSGVVSLGIFICPPVEFGYLSSSEPEQYLRTSLADSLLSRQIERLSALCNSLRTAKIPFRITAIVGDRDEDDYIWPVIGKPEGLEDSKLEGRRSDLLAAVGTYLTKEVKVGKQSGPRLVRPDELDVRSLADMRVSARAETVGQMVSSDPFPLGNLLQLNDQQAEVERMQELWEANGYYDGLPIPSRADLVKIVRLKFAAYAAQGVMLGELDSDLIMIQTERPPALRSAMLNQGRFRLGLEFLPFVYMQEPETESRAGERATATAEHIR